MWLGLASKDDPIYTWGDELIETQVSHLRTANYHYNAGSAGASSDFKLSSLFQDDLACSESLAIPFMRSYAQHGTNIAYTISSGTSEAAVAIIGVQIQTVEVSDDEDSEELILHTTEEDASDSEAQVTYNVERKLEKYSNPAGVQSVSAVLYHLRQANIAS